MDDNKIGTINVLNKSYTNKLSKKKAIVTIDIDFDKYTTLEKEEKLSKEISKYPEVELDYTIILDNKKYADLEEVLKSFPSKLIKNYRLIEVYENKYLIRYTLGSNNKTLEQLLNDDNKVDLEKITQVYKSAGASCKTNEEG